jgi:hypothetical protein
MPKFIHEQKEKPGLQLCIVLSEDTTDVLPVENALSRDISGVSALSGDKPGEFLHPPLTGASLAEKCLSSDVCKERSANGRD